jgi:hypothetical protein
LATTGNLFNGDFEVVPTDAPFDWNLTSAFGASVQVASLPQPGQHALLLQFGPGRVDYKDVKQLLLLAPGPYRFTGKLKSELVSQRGLEWRVSCLGKQQAELGRSEAVRSSDPGWRTFEFSFIVPDQDCRAQTVNLVFDARSASERFISGSIWFDDLRIVSEQKANAGE